MQNLMFVQASNNINNNNNNRNNNDNDNNQNNNNVNVANLAAMQMNTNMVMVGRKLRRQNFGQKSPNGGNIFEQILSFGETLSDKFLRPQVGKSSFCPQGEIHLTRETKLSKGHKWLAACPPGPELQGH